MRFSPTANHLFQQGDLSSALRGQFDAVPERVQAIAASVLRAMDTDEVVAQVADALKVTPVSLDLARKTMRRDEIQVDVTHDPRRIGFPGRRLVVPGIRVTISIPYQGDSELWALRPSTYRLIAVQGVVRPAHDANGGILDLVIEQPADEPLEAIKAELDSRLGHIDFFLKGQYSDLAGFDSQLRGKIKTAVSERQSRLQQHDSLSDLLGIEESTTSAPVTVRSRQSASTAAPGSAEEWDVFVSHASEDKKSFVGPLVAALTGVGLKVWYDAHVLTVGDSLRRSIDKGLARCRFGVVVISPSFLSKEWPQRELDGLVSREEDGQKVVLPVWHQISAGEIRRVSPMLADRLGVNSARGVEEVVRELLRVVRPG